MSSFRKVTMHPTTGEWEDAFWIDDKFGPHHYGVEFPSEPGRFYDPDTVKLVPLDRDQGIVVDEVVIGTMPKVDLERLGKDGALKNEATIELGSDPYAVSHIMIEPDGKIIDTVWRSALTSVCFVAVQWGDRYWMAYTGTPKLVFPGLSVFENPEEAERTTAMYGAKMSWREAHVFFPNLDITKYKTYEEEK